MTESNGSLLTSEEKSTCEQISKSNGQPDSQRARALLALNEDMSQAKAAELAGLTIGQVRYCLSRFRQLRTGIFSTQEKSQTTGVETDVTSQAA